MFLFHCNHFDGLKGKKIIIKIIMCYDYLLIILRQRKRLLVKQELKQLFSVQVCLPVEVSVPSLVEPFPSASSVSDWS